jgi:F0F1-type ATP synthase assembly protein I
MKEKERNHFSKPNTKKKSDKVNPYLQFSGMAFQMGVTIYLGNLLGEFLDEKNNNEVGLFSKICTLLAIALAIFSVIRKALKL